MALSEYWDKEVGAGGNYLRAGDWQVKVTGFDPFFANSGTPGVTFKLENTEGETRATFWLSEGSMARLASFAKACGMSREEAQQYDPMVKGNHSMLINHRVNVRVVLDDKGKYHQVDTDGCGWWAISQTGLSTPPSAPPPANGGKPCPI